MYDIFSLPDIKFLKGFIWGSATAGHQIEGNNIHSQRWKREQEGKLSQPSGMACNNYELYRQDAELVKTLDIRLSGFQWNGAVLSLKKALGIMKHCCTM